jgi:2-dehydro-3-deoxyphosphogluconate aldolase/(4S)-4-hydroxy-2-oxoglutarate aldolase
MSLSTDWKISPADVLNAGPVVPVIVIHELEHAVPLARALLAGGIKVLEVTLRTEVALDAIRTISREVPEALVGAGTVISAEGLREVQEAGGAFAISPGLTPALLDAALHDSIPLIPGISTASELMAGLERGYEYFKFFPAEAAGGIKMLKSIAGPFPQASFCPTGGITPDNCRDYLALETVVCVGGSWLAPSSAVSAGDWDAITELARNAASLK